MIFNNGELPNELIQAHWSGRLVLFVGAGASMGAPTCVPSFRQLAARVAASLEPDRTVGCAESPEFVLEEFAERGLGVHQMVHSIVCESTQPNPTHRAIASLALSVPPVRIVTTNYDRFLSATRLRGVTEFVAPNPPGGDEFEGIVHLHGSVSQAPQQLIVTRSDFADAYMAPQSSTMTFLQRLFTSNPVLFIGYSMNDVLMPYLLRASRGRTELYSLRQGTGSPEVDALGVRQIPYGCHADLPRLLHEWSRFAGASWAEHRERTRRIVTAPVPIEAQGPSRRSYLAYVVNDSDLVLQFTSQAAGARWCRWLAGLTQPEVVSSHSGAGTAARLQSWFADQVADDGLTPDDIAELFESGRPPPPIWVWHALLANSASYAREDPKAASRLIVAIADVAPPAARATCMRAIGAIFSNHPTLPDDAFSELVATWCALSTSLIGYRHRVLATADFWLTRPHLVGELLSTVDAHLRRASRLASLFDASDPSTMRASVQSRTVGDVMHRGHMLVDAARDLIGHLIVHDVRTAAGYLGAWSDSQWPMLNRLAIHGWSIRTDVTPAQGLEWLFEHEEWLWHPSVHRDANRLLARIVNHLGEASVMSLVTRLEQALLPSRAGYLVAALSCISLHARLSAAVEDALLRAIRGNPSAQLLLHSGFVNPNLLSIDTSIDDMEALATTSSSRSASAVVQAADGQGHGGPVDIEKAEHLVSAAAEASLMGFGHHGDEPWSGLRRFAAEAPELARVTHIRVVTRNLRSAGQDERSSQWRRWMRGYWRARLDSDPRPLTDAEASALADWAGLLDGDEFRAAAEFIMARPTALRHRSGLPRLLEESLSDRDAQAGLVDSYPVLVMRVLAHMLEHTEIGVAERFRAETRAVAIALWRRLDFATLAPLREQMTRLAWLHCVNRPESRSRPLP